MYGFSLAHGYFAPLILTPWLLVLWLIVAISLELIALVRRRPISTWLLSVTISSLALLGLLSIPAVFFQWMFIGSFAKSPHAADLMTYAAADGDRHTVAGYLSNGVSVESRNYEGSTAMFTAAAGGDLHIVQLLAAKGANLNATNDYGDSPLAAAIGRHHDLVTAYLKDHGAKEIKGTPEQRDAATKAIVERDIAKMNAK
jgi:hypothetical protein